MKNGENDCTFRKLPLETRNGLRFKLVGNTTAT